MARGDFKKILYFTFRFPYPPEKGGYNLRAFCLAKILLKKYKVDLLTLIENKKEEKYLFDLKKIFNQVFYFYHPGFFEYFGALKSFFSTKPLQVGYYFCPKVASWLKRNYQNYHLIFCSTIRSAEYVLNLPTRKVIDFVDAISFNYSLAKEYAKGFWKLIYFIENQRLLNYEIAVLKKLDLSFIASQKDKEYLIQNSKFKIQNAKLKTQNSKLQDLDAKIVVLPNGVKDEILKMEAKFQEKDIISFFGKMDYQPNEDAVFYFANEIFPHLKKEFPQLKFYILGTNPSKKVKKLARLKDITITGYLPNPYQILQKSKVIVAPIRFGAGIQNKVLEAMALGKAVVLSEVASRGIEGEDSFHFLVAKNPKEFVEKISSLLKDKEKRIFLGKNAKNLILEKYTWEKVGGKLISQIEKVIESTS